MKAKNKLKIVANFFAYFCGIWLFLLFLPTVKAELGWCQPTDFVGVIQAKEIKSIVLDAEYDYATDTSLFLVGGLANQGSGQADESFLYSFVDGGIECGVRHSYRITKLHLGIQGVSISDTVIWGIALTTGQDGIGISDKTNVLVRADKSDPTVEPKFYLVNFKGDEAGSVADRQTVLKMISFNDHAVALQSLSEIRMIDVKKNKVHGLYTLDIGDRFQQRDIAQVKQFNSDLSPSDQWHLYMAYPRYSYIEENLNIVVDRITVDSGLTLSNKINIFHGLSQSDPDVKEYKTLRFAINEETQYMAICAQIKETNNSGQTSTRNLFFTVELQDESNRQINLKAIDQPIGSNFECATTKIDEDGKLAYFLLNDSESHKTQVLRYDLLVNQMHEFKSLTLPYDSSHQTHLYNGNYAVFFKHQDFAMANIDSKLYGVETQNSQKVGYVIETRKNKRVNSYMKEDESFFVFSFESTFRSDPYPQSFLYIDDRVETTRNPVFQTFQSIIGVTADDVSMKSWISEYCPNSGSVSGSVDYVDLRLGVSFEYKFEGVSDITDIQRTCYPHLYITFDGPASASNIISNLSDVPLDLRFRMKLDNPDWVDQTNTIFGSYVSDSYKIDSSLSDKKYDHTVYAVIKIPETNVLPEFESVIPKLFIEAESSFSYTLPLIVDPEQPDQTVAIRLDNTNKDWLKLSSDQKRLYTDAGVSTQGKVGNYVFQIILNDGFQFGDNQSTFEVQVSITSKLNNIPYFQDPGIVAQTFICEDSFIYILPQTADDDGDAITLTLENTGAPWLKLSSDKKRLEVEALSTYGIQMVKSYEVTLILEDDSAYGQARTQSYTLSVTVEVPPNTLPTFEGLETQLVATAEQAWSIQLPPITSLEAKDVVTAQITDDLPWLSLNDNKDGQYSLSIDEGALIGNQTIGVYRFVLILNDNNIYGLSETFYPMKIEIIPPENTLPRFVNDVLISPEEKLQFTQGESFELFLPDIKDDEQNIEDIRIRLQNDECPWLKYSLLSRKIYVDEGKTFDVELGVYNFQVILNDFYAYAYSERIYDQQIEVSQSNKLPYFAEDLPASITFAAEKEFISKLPEIKDENGDEITVTLDQEKIPWMSYDQASNSLIVKKDTTTDDDFGKYDVVLTLSDGFQFGPNQATFSMKLSVKVAERPFHVYSPKNSGPSFVEELTEEVIKFNIGEAWEYLLPEIFDLEGDKVTIEIISEDTLFVQADVEPPRLYIEEGATTRDSVNQYLVQIKLTDIPVEGATPISINYELNIFGVDPVYLENLKRSEAPPIQVGSAPSVSIDRITQFGIVDISFSNALDFPEDIIDKINQFIEPIIVESGTEFVPKLNKYGFEEIPYVRIMVLASSEQELENLVYSWKVRSVTSTSMSFVILFETPVLISLYNPPDMFQIEFHIQEFVDSNGKGIRDNEKFKKFLPSQVFNNAYAQAITAQSENLYDATAFIMYIQAGVNLILNSAMEKLWIMVNGLQLIVIIPLLPVKLPAIMQMFLVPFIDIACFELIPTDIFFPFVFAFPESNAFNHQFQNGGYDSGYLPENMGTVFTLTHIFITCLVFTLPFFFFRRKNRCANKVYNYLKSKFIWNGTILFLFEGYMEIGICSLAIINRWNWDPLGTWQNQVNMLYGACFVALFFTLPIAMTAIYCYNHKKVDKKMFRKYMGAPFAGLKRNHKIQNIFYVSYYLFRRMIFLITITMFEQNIVLALMTLLFSTEISLMFLVSRRPFDSRTRNNLEIFNEFIMVIMVFTTYCFANVMEPEATEIIGDYFLILLGLYMFIHVIGLLSDSVVKVCQVIWSLLSKCAIGKRFQKRVKKRYDLLVKKPKKKQRFRRIPKPLPPAEPSISSNIDSVNSSMSIADYEDIINQYTARNAAGGASEQTSNRASSARSGSRSTAQLANNMLIVQRQHERLDPIDYEMEFWMAEIEKFEKEEEDRKVEILGIVEEQPTKRDQYNISSQELQNINPKKLVFVPEDWMKGKNDDNAFEHVPEMPAEVTSLNHLSDPIQVMRKKKSKVSTSQEKQASPLEQNNANSSILLPPQDSERADAAEDLDDLLHL